MPPECSRIVVSGGGIGGLAVALALGSRGYDVTVLEGDASFDARRQGYGLTIQQGGTTLRAFGITDAVQSQYAESTSHYIFDKHGGIAGYFGRAFSAPARDSSTRAPVPVSTPPEDSPELAVATQSSIASPGSAPSEESSTPKPEPTATTAAAPPEAMAWIADSTADGGGRCSLCGCAMRLSKFNKEHRNVPV